MGTADEQGQRQEMTPTCPSQIQPLRPSGTDEEHDLALLVLVASACVFQKENRFQWVSEAQSDSINGVLNVNLISAHSRKNHPLFLAQLGPAAAIANKIKRG